MRRCFVVLLSNSSPLLLILAASTCEAPRHPLVVLDSAGIRIVENSAPLWQEGKGWHLRPDPVLDIGGQGEPQYELFRVGSAFRLDDERVAIANAGTNEIRIFDNHGTYLSTVGGAGSGPGEFQRLIWAGRYRGDSLAAYQFTPTYLTVFDEHGRYQRVTPSAPHSGRLVGVAQDGTLFSIIPAVTRLTFPKGVIRDSVILMRTRATQPIWDSVGTYTGNDILYLDAGGRLAVALPLFPRQTDIVVHGFYFYVASNDSYEIRKHRLDGRLEMIVRRNVQARPLRKAHVESLLQDVLTPYTDPAIRQVRERALREALPPTLPVLGPSSAERAMSLLSAVYVDGLENIWVRDYPIPGSSVNPTWSVFDSTGVLQGRVDFPARFHPFDIGSNYVLGLWRDVDDTEHVRMYDLVKQ